MTDEEFWRIIAASRAPLRKEDGGEDTDRQEAELKRLLSALPAERVAGFAERFHFFKAQAYHWDLWAAAYLIAGGCSDDSFLDFRNGLIASGKEVYEAALANADSLADVATPDGDSLFFETFGYVADKVYEEKTGGEAPLSETQTPEIPAGEPWSDDDEEITEQNLSRRLPRLYAIFGDEE